MMSVTPSLLRISIFKIGIPIYLFIILVNEKVLQYIIPIIGLGVIVRWSEFNDKKVFALTNNIISGHALKHILGGIQLYVVILLLHKLNKVKV